MDKNAYLRSNNKINRSIMERQQLPRCPVGILIFSKRCEKEWGRYGLIERM